MAASLSGLFRQIYVRVLTLGLCGIALFLSISRPRRGQCSTTWLLLIYIVDHLLKQIRRSNLRCVTDTDVHQITFVFV